MNFFVVLINVFVFLMMFIPIIGFWSFVCYRKIKKWRDYKKRCTLRVLAEVTDILWKSPRELHVRAVDPINKPVFKVCYMGQEIIIDSAPYTNLITFKPEQEFWLYVNPENFQDFMYGEPHGTVIRRLDIGMCVLCWFMLAAAFLLMIVL